jgi:sulfur-oxidizing protein SoxY
VTHRDGTTRRQILMAAVGGLALPAIRIERATATPDSMKAAIRKIVGESPVKKGRVELDVPPLVENGNTVSLAVNVQSPMTAADHVKAIHVFNEKNPQPNVISVQLGPRAGRAHITTRFRLADTQHVTAIAEMSDGTFWSDTVEVIVTLAACVEEF